LKKTQSKILPKQIEDNTGGKKTLRTAFQVISTSILIISLGLAVFLPFRKIAVNPALAAPLLGVPIDDVTLVNTTDTSLFSTPNDPTDDTIDYTPDIGFIGDDIFEYEICDSTPLCLQATVTVTVTVTPVTQVYSPDTPLSLTANAAVSTFEAIADTATVVENTILKPSFVNINVLGNDDFGPNGPALTGPITIFADPPNGIATVSNGPRSPDPAGITYLSNSNKLLISDSEVNELFPGAVYTGVNLFLTDLLGSLDSTLTTYDPSASPPITFSNEPTGVAFNTTPDDSGNHHLFFTDDTGMRGVYELDPGADGFYNTLDDIITSFDTGAIGGTDPEGVAYDSWRDHLIVVDGSGLEVYDIDLVDGTLNGNETVTSFDVTGLGITTPEGVEFNPDNGHLYILSRTSNKIAETTVDGTLFRYLDISSANANHPAGLAYAPASGDPGQKNLYIVDRGKDNDKFPFENDGKMYEVSFPPDVPPAVDAGPNQAIIVLNDATLDGTVIDGRNPAGAMTALWEKISGPGTVIFADANAVDTTATFATVGDYVLQLTANDGTRSASDEVTVLVIPPGNLPPAVAAGPDQTITLPFSATLDGTVTDDDLPAPPNLTSSWSVVSTPPGGTVAFADANAVDTSATFSIVGDYVLRLTASDGVLSAFDDITIKVNQSEVQRIWLPMVFSNP
jgi:hypothetical protein